MVVGSSMWIPRCKDVLCAGWNETVALAGALETGKLPRKDIQHRDRLYQATVPSTVNPRAYVGSGHALSESEAEKVLMSKMLGCRNGAIGVSREYPREELEMFVSRALQMQKLPDQEKAFRHPDSLRKRYVCPSKVADMKGVPGTRSYDPCMDKFRLLNHAKLMKQQVGEKEAHAAYQQPNQMPWQTK